MNCNLIIKGKLRKQNKTRKGKRSTEWHGVREVNKCIISRCNNGRINNKNKTHFSTVEIKKKLWVAFSNPHTYTNNSSHKHTYIANSLHITDETRKKHKSEHLTKKKQTKTINLLELQKNNKQTQVNIDWSCVEVKVLNSCFGKHKTFGLENKKNNSKNRLI